MKPRAVDRLPGLVTPDREVSQVNSITQTCTKCGQTKPLDDQHWRRDKKFNSWRRQCRTCYQEEDRERWHARKPQPTQYTAETPREQSIALVPENVHLLIDVESERVNLTSMWRASGAPESKRPANWKQTEQAREFLAELAETVIGNGYNASSAQRGGAEGGSTWEHWQAGAEYARYLSPAFAIRWNNYARAYLEGDRRIVDPLTLTPASDEDIIQYAADLHRLTARLLDAHRQREEAKDELIDRATTPPAVPRARVTDPRRAGKVYLIEKVNSRPREYKIGKTQVATSERKRGIEGQANITTRVLKVIETDDVGKLEPALHRVYKRKRIAGEWFALADSDVSALCNLPSFVKASDFNPDMLATVVVVQGALL